MSGSTPSQTVGPFFNIGLRPLNIDSSDTKPASAKMFRLTGQVLDGNRVPVPDALLEFWHADPDGHYAGLCEGASSTRKDFQGFLRTPTDSEGRFSLETMRPGRLIAPDGVEQAAHIVVLIFMRGLLRHLHSRVYFADDPRCQSDRILLAVPGARRHTLLGQPETDRADRYIWNVHMQGQDETVFFEL